MASFNDEASVEDEALTDREDEEVRDSPIDLHNMVNLCENTMRQIIMKRTLRGKQVMVDLVDGCTGPIHEEQQQNNLSSRARARDVADIQELAASLYPSSTKKPPMVRLQTT
jgi:hypothetical protein